jgi:D-sedoheptulose 7-phosphate isomerase
MQKNKTVFFSEYASRLQTVLTTFNWNNVSLLAQDMMLCWVEHRQVFICGNGGSAGNAIHLANDFLYGVAKKTGGGIRVSALSANAAVITCLGNDLGYESIYSEQLAVQGKAGDLLIALSGSGNSPNIIKTIEQAKIMGVKSYAILGYSGGICKEIVDVPIHFQINDMQIAEDLQLIVGHMIMQRLYDQRSKN